MRSALSGNPWRYVRSREPADLGTLVSPLRFDIAVRADFYRFADEHDALWRSDFEAFVDRLESHAYFTWFREVNTASFHRHLLADPARLREAFAARTRRALALADSYREGGFRRGETITLLGGRHVTPPSSGRPAPGPYFAGDGCHRLALLLRDGARELAPDMYRVRMYRRLHARDVTSTLIAHVRPSPAEYCAFLSLGYAKEEIRDAGALLADVERRTPERLAELRRVMDLDRDALGSAA